MSKSIKSLIDSKCFGCEFWDYDKNKCSTFFCTKEYDGKCRPIQVSSKTEPIDKKSLTQEEIDDIIKESEIITMTMFDKTTIVIAKLPNGFVIVESSSCVSPENYDVTVGKEICMERIENKIWELEGYALQKKLGGK